MKTTISSNKFAGKMIVKFGMTLKLSDVVQLCSIRTSSWTAPENFVKMLLVLTS